MANPLLLQKYLPATCRSRKWDFCHLALARSRARASVLWGKIALNPFIYESFVNKQYVSALGISLRALIFEILTMGSGLKIGVQRWRVVVVSQALRVTMERTKSSHF